MRYIKWIVTGIILTLSLAVVSYNYYVQQEYAKELIRFHIIANSNTIEDQILKLRVRDAVVTEMKERFADIDNKEEALIVTRESFDDIKKIAQEQVTKAGKDYKVEVMLGDYLFPTKTYGDITLPAGRYRALRVVIGEGRGHNWWCVLFPPLCFVNGVDKLPDGQQPKGVKVFEKDDVQFRLRSLEIFN
ncbi:stage II sporulation protein R [Desulfohalotomaculum tongense]|uniref:stage II sporulation protein R n=1 Tax=Desulforadius tongensis TaxID=1216062 RepID=UPI00195678AB|nr:stage II sporulation protein R [Desulforadius tongensis]MBM7854582.1 stage II sporulation protein R [Desulforadius tongensis]